MAFVGPVRRRQDHAGQPHLPVSSTRRAGACPIGGADVRDIPKEQLMDTVSFVFQNSRLHQGLHPGQRAAGQAQRFTGRRFWPRCEHAQCADILRQAARRRGHRHRHEGRLPLRRRAAAHRHRPGDAEERARSSSWTRRPPLPTRTTRPGCRRRFSNLSRGKTVIMIAHRLSTVADVDRIYVIEDGTVAESGTGRELLDAGRPVPHGCGTTTRPPSSGRSQRRR